MLRKNNREIVRCWSNIDQLLYGEKSSKLVNSSQSLFGKQINGMSPRLGICLNKESFQSWLIPTLTRVSGLSCFSNSVRFHFSPIDGLLPLLQRILNFQQSFGKFSKILSLFHRPSNRECLNLSVRMTQIKKCLIAVLLTLMVHCFKF